MSFDNINNFAKKFWIFSYIRTECESQILPSRTKVHKNLCHKSEGQTIKLFQLAGKLNKRTRNTIKNVIENCQLCRQFKKTPPRPRVGMPEAVTVNQVVSLDLKEIRSEKKHILYCVDEFRHSM